MFFLTNFIKISKSRCSTRYAKGWDPEKFRKEVGSRVSKFPLKTLPATTEFAKKLEISTKLATASVKPSQPLGQNQVFAAANGAKTSMPGIPSSCSQPNNQNPADLLPKDSNDQWAQLNPSGKGDLANINLLKAGYHIGIDTVGQSLRNANLQLRSEPANPQMNVGPWNNTTIEPDVMRVPLELGQGAQ